MDEEHVLCPDCGWSGPKTDLTFSEGIESCPVCDTDIEFVE